MKITLTKEAVFFLPELLTLVDPNCVSSSNSTHVWLQTAYESCQTSRKVNYCAYKTDIWIFLMHYCACHKVFYCIEMALYYFKSLLFWYPCRS